MRKVLLLAAVVGVTGFVFQRAYRAGQEKYTYTLQAFDRFVPLPNLYDSYPGSAKRLKDGRLKITWTYTSAPAAPSVRYWTVLGTVATDTQPYYVLEMDGALYMEKAENVEPLLKALCALARGGPEDNHPTAMAEVIACLPDDPDTLINLAARFKAPKVYR